MTPEERKEFRRKLANAVLAIQGEATAAGMPPVVFIYEMIAALLSLAAFTAANNAHLSRAGFLKAARAAADEYWR